MFEFNNKHKRMASLKFQMFLCGFKLLQITSTMGQWYLDMIHKHPAHNLGNIQTTG
jgi:hypothetical protein